MCFEFYIYLQTKHSLRKKYPLCTFAHHQRVTKYFKSLFTLKRDEKPPLLHVTIILLFRFGIKL